jgi:F0F1-type ATP synthase epsilon subunit
MNKKVKVKILTPYEVIFESEAEAVVSENTTGSFGILPEHANFITLVQNKPITVHFDKDKKKEFQFPLAIIYASNNVVKIYTDILAQPLQKVA